ncbi:MAG: hypothetical protein F6J98_47980, partial [Moorea sp. SIO4G2]|nr:hypothetical protein [Moorena sp. SIO4G2]
ATIAVGSAFGRLVWMQLLTFILFFILMRSQMRWHGAAAAKSGNDHAHPITRCSAVAQPENTGSKLLYLTLLSLQALEY